MNFGAKGVLIMHFFDFSTLKNYFPTKACAIIRFQISRRKVFFFGKMERGDFNKEVWKEKLHDMPTIDKMSVINFVRSNHI